VSSGTEGSPSHRIAANAILRTGGELVAKAASLAFFVVMARELGTEDFGEFNFALSLATLVIPAAGFGMDALLAREVARDREGVHGYMSNVVAVKGLGALALLAVMALVVNLAGYEGDAKAAVYLVGAGVALENLGRTWQAAMQAHERLGLVSGALIVQRTVTSVVAIALMLDGAGLVAVSAVFLGGAAVGLLAAHLLLRARVVVPRREVDRSRWLPLVRAGIPIGIVTLLFGMLLQLDVVLLSLLGGDSDEVGVYGAAFRIVAATMFLSWAFGQATQPWLARQQDDRAMSLARGYELGLKTLTAVLLPIGVGFATLAEPIVETVYGDGYEGAVVPLRLLGTVVALYGLNQFTSVLLISRYRPGDMRRNLIVVLVQNIVCNVILIPPLGADGAAISGAASAVLLGGLSLHAGWRVTGRLSLPRAFGGPAVAAVAMAAVLLAVEPSLWAGVPLGAAVYAAVLAAWERLANPGDLHVVLTTLRRRAPVPAP
jgi:O-antigen/teichoic acid export membrane protein